MANKFLWDYYCTDTYDKLTENIVENSRQASIVKNQSIVSSV